MKTRTGFSLAVLAAAILLLLPIAPMATAQDYDQDPPARAGRIGYVRGSVSFQPGGQGDWLEAVPNRPLTTGDNLWVDRDSRAEVQIGSTSIRLGPETSLTFLELGNDVTQLRLSMGSVFFRVRHFGGDNTFEVDAPNLAFNVNQGGEFRLDVNENGDQTVATVWRGEAEITGGGDSYRLRAGQQGTFSGVDRLSYDVEEIGSPDSFGRWALSRDEREDRALRSHHVSEEMTGYEDLDDYGRWHEVEGYGTVWTPAGVPGNWAPYRYGQWVYVSPWGWTWVEEEPWGFAPFHYGRWAFVASSWCWVPGPVAVVPVYSPALVAFVGGGGFSIGIGIGGGVGWFPLGPGEVFVPWYRTSPRYVQNVNVTNTNVNVTQVTNVYNNVTVNHVTNVTYVNQRVTNSVTVVNHDTFVSGQPVHNNLVRVDARQIASAPVTHETITSIQPARQSVVGTARPVQMRPPEQAMSRPVVATRQPAAMARPMVVPGVERAATPAPVRTVHAAPPTEARPLERGARGGTPGLTAPAPNPAGPRPGAPENRPGALENNRGTAPRTSDVVPRPGAAENNPNAAPRPGESAPRPGVGENNRGAAPRPAAPEPNPSAAPRPGSPENNRGATPDNNRPAHEVPRPPSAGRPQEQPPGRTQEQTPQARPEERRPSAPPNARQENRRPDETPRTNPEASTRPPETRQQSAPPTKEQPAPPRSRQETSPPPETRQEPAPRPDTRSEPAPRPESRPAEPPPQRESRQPEQRNERPEKPQREENKNKDNKDKEPPKSKYR